MLRNRIKQEVISVKLYALYAYASKDTLSKKIVLDIAHDVLTRRNFRDFVAEVQELENGEENA